MGEETRGTASEGPAGSGELAATGALAAMGSVGASSVGRVSAAMRAAAPGEGAGAGAADAGPLAQVLMARLFPSQIARPRIGRFDLLEFIGEGGMGSVYLAYDRRLDRRVAVKFLRAGGGAQGEARLLREAQAMARLSHPNIVAVHEVWEEEGRVHVAMEYVQGETLARWQAEGRPWREVVAVYRQAGEGLAAAHAAGLVHRDFKPHNAILREDGVVKVLDFGLARASESGGSEAGGSEARESEAREGEARESEAGTDGRLTRTGAILGTPVYMAPEQHLGAPADARSDQYALCVALWEGLYGQLPVPSGSLAELRAAALSGQRVEPPSGRGVPAWLRRVVERGMSKEPGDRYPSMRALVRELGRDPAARWRRAGWAAAVAVAAVGAGLGIAEVRGEAAAACAVDEVRGAALWGAERRAAAEAGVMATGLPAAGSTWARVGPLLDAYAEGLATMRAEACETHRRGLHSDSLYDRRVACLDRREAGFSRLVELLAAGESEVVLRAAVAVGELEGVAACGDTAALAAEVPPPAEAWRARRVAGLREELARAQAEESAGKYAEAEARAARVRAWAEPLGYAPLAAEADLRWGSAAMQRGGREASARLEMSLWTAIRFDLRAVAAEAAAKRVFARVEIDDRAADVREAIALAESLAERTGAGEWRIRWTLANNVATALERRGELAAALGRYREALALVPTGAAAAAQDAGGRGGAGEGAFERAATLQNMATLQVALGEGAAGEASAREAARALAGLYGPEHPSTASAEAVLAVVLARVGRRAEAEGVLAGAIARARRAGEEAPIWMLVEAGRIALMRDDRAGVRRWCAAAEPLVALPGGGRSPWALPVAALLAEAAARDGEADAFDVVEAVDPEVRRQNQGFVALARARVALALGEAAAAAAITEALMASGVGSEAEIDEARLIAAQAAVAMGEAATGRGLLEGLLGEAGGRARLHEPEARALALRTLAELEALAGDRAAARRRAAAAVAALEGFDDPSPPLTAARELAARLAGE